MQTLERWMLCSNATTIKNVLFNYIFLLLRIKRESVSIQCCKIKCTLWTRYYTRSLLSCNKIFYSQVAAEEEKGWKNTLWNGSKKEWNRRRVLYHSLHNTNKHYFWIKRIQTIWMAHTHTQRERNRDTTTHLDLYIRALWARSALYTNHASNRVCTSHPNDGTQLFIYM